MPNIARSMPPATSSSAASSSASDALANLTKAATIALTAVQGVQEQTHAELSRLRAERDDALKELHEAQLEAKDSQARGETWKAAASKSDLTIKHQTETITQLKAEVQQWKAQLARIEETSRQEVESWKEQYRRTEHERARLSVRLEEMLAGQYAWNAAAHAYTAPYTPRMTYADMGDPSTSSGGTKRASTTHSHRAGTPHAHSRPPLGEDDSPPMTTVRKSKAPHSARAERERESRSRHGSPARASTSKRKDKDRELAAQAGPSRATPRAPAEPQQRLIRRVTAIVDVKEEEDSDREPDGFDHDVESATSGSAYEPESPKEFSPVGPRKRRGSGVSAKSRRIVPEWEDEDGEEWDEDEGVGDDELLISSKTRKQPRTPASGTKPRANAGAKQLGTTKKRKLDAEGLASAGRGGTAKAAKMR